MKKKFFPITLLCILIASQHVNAQRLMGLSRYDDNFKSLAEDSAHAFTLLPEIKSLHLKSDHRFFIAFGGEIREQLQVFNNESWGSLPPGVTESNTGKPYLLQRYMFHSNLQLSRYVRIFGELKSGFVNHRATGPRPGIDEDHLDLHQAFADINLFPSANSFITLRTGRQELNYGASRLISVNEGPNVRQAFQGIKLLSGFGNTKIDAFYTNPVTNLAGSFDDKANKAIKLYGLYTSNKTPALADGNLDAYFIGYHNDVSSYLKGNGVENRYSFGLRLYSNPGSALSYDVEAIYQTGTFATDHISAYMAVAEMSYTFKTAGTQPVIGLVGQIASGDRGKTGRLNTFNPLYTRVYFGLGMPYWPSNLMQLTPTFEIKPVKKLTVDAAVHSLWRQSTDDGLYLSGRSTRSPYLTGTMTISRSRFVGFQEDLNFSYAFTNYFSLEADFSGLPASTYIKETGVANGIFFSNFQAKFRF